MPKNKTRKDYPDPDNMTENDWREFVKKKVRSDDFSDYSNTIQYLDPINPKSKRILRWLILKADEDYSIIATKRLLPVLTQTEIAKILNSWSYDWHIKAEIINTLDPESIDFLDILDPIITSSSACYFGIARFAIERLCTCCKNNLELITLADRCNPGLRSTVLGFLKYDTNENRQTIRQIFKDRERDFVIRQKMLQFFKHELSDSELIYIANTDPQVKVRIKAIKALKNPSELVRNFLLKFMRVHGGHKLGITAKKKFKHLVGYEASIDK